MSHGFLFIILPKNLWAIYYLNFACLKKYHLSLYSKRPLGLSHSLPQNWAIYPLVFGFECYGAVGLQVFFFIVGAFAAFIPSLFLKFFVLITPYFFLGN